MPSFSFRKNEILRKKKLIDSLFTEGASFFVHPLKIFWLTVPSDSAFAAQVMISASKRAFPHSTDRNRIRRQLREAYRKQKHYLYDHLAQNQQQCILAIIYTSNVRIASVDLEIKIKTMLKRLFLELDKKTD
jgi:ribonuclease P protein component